MMIPKYIPALFADNPLTAEETALLKSTGSKFAPEYEELIAECTRGPDLRTELIRFKLAGFESAFERMKMGDIQRNISSVQCDYDIQLSSLQLLAQRIQELKYTLAGLECAVNSRGGDSELMEYFICSKNLNLINVTSTLIEFTVHCCADVYNEEAFEQYVSNHHGYMYNGISTAVTKPQKERLYRALFGSRKLKLRMCAAFRADMQTGLKAVQHYTFPAESSTYFPNPHIQNHGCTGTYAARFQEYMNKQDYAGAIEQASVSARNLNFYDSAVIGNLAGTLFNSTIKCIEKPDGTLLTPSEAIYELEEEELDICPDPLS
jgi:hypothetical protein